MTKDNCLFCKYSVLSTTLLARMRLDQNSEEKVFLLCTHEENHQHHITPIGPPKYSKVKIKQITTGHCSRFEP